MKYLVVFENDNIVTPVNVFEDLRSAINCVKSLCCQYCNNNFYRIYTLDKPFTCRYLDGKVFID